MSTGSLFTEDRVVSALYGFFSKRNHQIMVHNTTQLLMYVGESDFISINRSGFVTEVEVKVTRADFRNDFTKKKRHEHLSGRGYSRQRSARNPKYKDYPVEVKRTRSNGESYTVKTTHRVVCGKYYDEHVPPSESIPNYFYYAYPHGLMDPEEVPPYCGILEIHESRDRDEKLVTYYAVEIRKPKRLHNRKPNDKQKVCLLRTQMFRVANRSMIPYRIHKKAPDDVSEAS